MNNTPSNAVVLSNLSESSFRFYEPHLRKAVAAWPEETEFRGEHFRTETGYPLSPNTFAARMRDAIVSLHRFGWETTIDTKKLWAIRGEFSVAFGADGQSVWFRRKGRRGRPSQLVTEARKEGAPVLGDADLVRTPWEDATWAEIEAVCLLITTKRLTGPIFLSRALLSAECDNLLSRFDVGLTPDTAKNQTIIT